MSSTAVRFAGLEMCLSRRRELVLGRKVRGSDNTGCTFCRVSEYDSWRDGPVDASFLLDTAAVPSDTTDGMYCNTVIRMFSVVSDFWVDGNFASLFRDRRLSSSSETNGQLAF